MGMRIFICYCCRRECYTKTTEEEAEAEFVAHHNGQTQAEAQAEGEEIVSLCDVCYARSYTYKRDHR